MVDNMTQWEISEFLMKQGRKLRQKKLEAIQNKRPLSEIREIDARMQRIARELVETEG